MERTSPGSVDNLSCGPSQISLHGSRCLRHLSSSRFSVYAACGKHEWVADKRTT